MYSVLHIDNSIVMRRVFRDLFEKNGFRLFEAQDPQEALFLLGNQSSDSGERIRLIITAMEFEKESGTEFIKKLSEGPYKDIPVIVVTASDSLETRTELFRCGIIDYLLKQTPARELIEYMDKVYVQRLRSEDDLSRRLRHLKIAVLDDSLSSLSLIRNLLEYNNIRNAVYYSNPADLLKDTSDFHIYLIDIILPEISGEQVIAAIRQRNRNSMVIAISGIDHYRTISSVLLSGADDYIIKPFNASIFMAKLKASARVCSLLEEIDESRREMDLINRKLKKMVLTDGLTGLYNHRYIYDQLESQTAEASASGIPLSVLMLDIDYFKTINDTYGHQAGDQVLSGIAKVISETLPEKCTAGRYGGEEFMIIYKGLNTDQAVAAANELRLKISGLKFTFTEKTITASGGVAAYEPGRTAMETVSIADRHLYKAKESGRNRIIA